MPLIRRLSSPRTVAACLGVCVACLVLAGASLRHVLAEANASAASVSQSEGTLLAIAKYRASVRSMVAAERGYLLSRDPAYTAEREEARRQAEAALLRLELASAEDALQASRVVEIASLFRARMATTWVPGSDAAAPEGVAAFGSIDPLARRLAAESVAAADEFEQAQRATLAARQAINQRRQRQQLITVAVAFGGFALLTLVVGTALYLETRRRRRSEARFSAIVDGLPLTVWEQVSTGREREFIYIGSGCLQDRGVDPELLREDANASLDNVLEEDRETLAGAFERSERSGTLDHTYRIRVQGRLRWVNARARGRRTASGSMRWTGYWTDVTEQKELERRLREATGAAQRANEAKGDFLAVMSHEIRTPLNGMLGLMELMAMTNLAPDQRDMLATAREAGQSLSRIIDDVLDFSRVEAGHLALHPVPASVEAVVQRSCLLHQAVALRKGLRLDWSVDAQPGQLLVFDPLRVGQILSNFLSNALKFTSRGCVRVAAERVAAGEGRERVRLSVTDTGIGVAPDVLARIFEPFFQAEPGTYAQYGGSGLGLAICRQLARAMGGDVHMRSTRGEGTEVVLEAEFPLAPAADVASPPTAQPAATVPAPPPAPPRPAPSIERAEREGTLVLVADDHPTNRALLVRQLHALGYAAIGAEDGPSALRLWSSRAIGLLLCDCNMPGMTGFELAREIRGREQAARRPRLPILACTALASPGDRERCLEAGMDGCLLKPLGLADLAQHLDRCLPLPARPAAAPAEAGDAFDVLADFAGWHERDLGALATAVAAQDFEQARLLAHRMAGAAAMVRAPALAESCLAVEDAARQGHAPTVELEFEELRRQSRRFEQARRAHAPAPAAGVQGVATSTTGEGKGAAAAAAASTSAAAASLRSSGV